MNILKDINESETVIVSDDVQLKKEILDLLSIEIPGAKFDPRVRAGIWDGLKKFYRIEQGYLLIPKGLVFYVIQLLQKNNKEYQYTPITTDYAITMDEHKEFIKTLNLPFEPYDFQIQSSFDMIKYRRGVQNSCTGCLDPSSKILCKIDGTKSEITFEEIEYLRTNNKKVKVQTPSGFSEIGDVYIKDMKGYNITFDDASTMKCAETHHVLSNEEWKPANHLEINDYMTDKFGFNSKKIVSITDIKEQKWIDFEVLDEFHAYIQNDIIHHNSGKSLILYIYLMFMFKNDLKALLVVPTIALTLQMRDDFIDYGLEKYTNQKADELIKLIGGEFTNKDLSTHPITISTWQSLQYIKPKEFDLFDALAVDECHTVNGETLANIIKSSKNSKWKVGLTGSIPKDKILRTQLLATLGRTFQVIKPQGLIDKGLATPITINNMYLNYSDADKLQIHKMLSDRSNKRRYHEEEDFINAHIDRNKYVSDLILDITEKHGNTLALFNKIEHGKLLLKNVIESKTGSSDFELLDKITPKPLKEAFQIWRTKKCKFYMNSEITDKDKEKIIKTITKESNKSEAEDFCNSIISLTTLNVYFIYGAVNGTDREKIRRLLETVDTTNSERMIILASYGTTSTGVNYKNLHNIVLAGNTKSFVKLTQTIGRGMRLHASKKMMHIWDIIDDISYVNNRGTKKENYCLLHAYERIELYLEAGYPIIETEIDLQKQDINDSDKPFIDNRIDLDF